MSPTTLFVLLIGAWRLSRILSDDTELGPGNILLKMRLKLGVEYDEWSVARSTNTISEMILCIKCVSLWTGLLLTALYILSSELALVVALPFALSAAAVWIGDRA